MQQFPFWQQQLLDKPLFPDVEWNRPEQRSLAGRLSIIGGNKLGFSGVAEAYSAALKAGVGEAKVLLPDALKKTVPPTVLDAQFASSNLSGGFSREALNDIRAIADWGSAVLLIGDNGRSSETAIVYDDFIRDYSGWLTLTRDSIDLLRQSYPTIVEREKTLFVASFAQVQKLFQGVYYPKVLTFSMQLAQFVDALHKFTITHPVTILTLHKDTLIIAHDGKVITQNWQNPMAIWRGTVATRAASYLLWTPEKPLEAIATSIYQS